MGKSSDGSDFFTPERRDKWLGRSRTHYGKVSTTFTAASGFCGVGALFLPSDTEVVLAVLASAFATGAWFFRNADKDKLDTRSTTDFDGLVSAIDKSHSGLGDAASVSPEAKLAKNYIATVLEKLRVLLEPEGKDNYVRICLYRKDSGERKEDSDGDPLIEKVYKPENESEATEAFTRYVFELGGRTDQPRWDFNSTKPPGSEFFSELFLKGRFECKSPEELPALNEDDYYKGRKSKPAYKSFVNIALQDEDNETFAMLTCDSIESYFFDERRNRLITAFLPLIKLALQDGATNVPEPKRRRDQIGLDETPPVPGPKKPNPNLRKSDIDGR